MASPVVVATLECRYNIEGWVAKEEPLILDTEKGFNRQMSVEISTASDACALFWFPAFTRPYILDHGMELDMSLALQIGLIEFVDENDDQVELDLDHLGSPPLLTERGFAAVSGGTFCHSLILKDPRLSRQLSQRLLIGQEYKIRFTASEFPILSKLDEGDEVGEVGGHRAFPLVGSDQYRTYMRTESPAMSFTMIHGIRRPPAPHFELEMSISSSKLCARHHQNFFVSMTITSFETRAVTICPILDRNYEYGQRSHQETDEPMLRHFDCSRDLFDVFDLFELVEEDTGRIIFAYSDKPLCEESSPHEHEMEKYDFNRSSEYKRTVTLDEDDLALLETGARYSLRLRAGGISSWNYGSVVENFGTFEQRVPYGDPLPEWMGLPPIHFENVSAVSRTLRIIFEREKPQPLFRLPLELREVIYTYLRYSQRANIFRFNVTDNH